jgi:hypothetical protein
MRYLIVFACILLPSAGVALPVDGRPCQRGGRPCQTGGGPLQVTLPNEEGLLPERYGVSSDAANSNCLGCHSAAMITTQPRFTRVQWGETIAKMRSVYGAPIDPADDKAILDWLVAD